MIYPKIACCAIVKNEEEVLERMIKSVKFMVNRFIIVDTGSTDSTKDIIRKYGKLYEIPFENFVDTKNKVLEIVDQMEDIDYILWMDADEILSENDQKLLDIVRNNKQFDFIDTNICDLMNDGSKTILYTRKRVWKNHNYKNGWRFEGPFIHEYMNIPSDKFVIAKDIVVYHKHKTKGKDYNGTFDFYIKMLNEALVRNPDDTRGRFYLARTYKDMLYSTKDKQYLNLALESYNKYFETCDRIGYNWIEEKWQCMFDISDCYKLVDDYKNSIIWLKKSIELDKRRAESYYTLALHYFYADGFKNIELSKKYAKEALSKMVPVDVILFLDSRFYNEYPLDLLSLICWETKQYDEGIKYLEQMLSLKNNSESHKESIKQNIRAFVQQLSKIPSKEIKKSKFNTIDNYFEKIFVINLNQRTDRWEQTKKQLEELGIYKAERYNAINGEILGPLTDKNILVKRTPGYLACCLSHLDIVWQAKQNGWKNVLILEDDNIFHKNLIPEFNNIVNDLESVYPNWDIWFLSHATFDGQYSFEKEQKGEMKYDTTIQKYDKQVVQSHNSWACNFYAIRDTFYDVILDYYKDKFDWELDRFFLDKIQPYPEKYCSVISYPQLSIQDPKGFSDNYKGQTANWTTFINTEYSTIEDYIE